LDGAPGANEERTKAYMAIRRRSTAAGNAARCQKLAAPASYAGG